MGYETLDKPLEEESKISTELQPHERAILSGRVCGNCKYFSAREGQRLMEGQRFVERLVKENLWKVHHLGSPTADLGDCGAHRSGSSSDETMLTGKMHAACDQYREK